ncbi:MAG: cytochrome c maturation protein CcmE [Coriobacteriia bacterium]|nr:cytochrome c maturation protein CcmE [Coriobacteriia bacterium]
MNSSAKKRLITVGILIVMIMVAAVAFFGTGQSSQALSIQEASSGQYNQKRIQVSGAVVDDSLEVQGDTATFTLTGEPGTNDTGELKVVYAGALPATFGNGIVAICTGTLVDGTLKANQMLTKCPSKYESAQGALTVANLLENPEEMYGVETKLAGYLVAGSLQASGGEGPRFQLESQGLRIDVYYDDALSVEFVDGAALVLTGALNENHAFVATSVAIDSNI